MENSTFAALMAGLPGCALGCMASSVSVSHCALTDLNCLCSNQPLNAAVETCVLANCTFPEALTTKNATQTACGDPIRTEGAIYMPLSAILFAATSVFVLTRILVKRFMATCGLSLDDWFIIATWFTLIGSTVVNHLLVIDQGLGRDVWTLSPQTVTNFLQGFYLMELLYFAEVTMLKLSIVASYSRIFPGTAVRWILLGTAAFVVMYGIAFEVVGILQCTPIDYFWMQFSGPNQGKCINFSVMAWAHAAINIALDLWLLAIPISHLRSLNMSLSQKLGVASMFLVGSLFTVISVVRFMFLLELQDLNDPTRDFYHVLLWSTAEITVGVMCTCMPTLRLVLSRLTQHFAQRMTDRRSPTPDWGFGRLSDPHTQRPSEWNKNKEYDSEVATTAAGHKTYEVMEKPLPSLPSPRSRLTRYFGPEKRPVSNSVPPESLNGDSKGTVEIAIMYYF